MTNHFIDYMHSDVALIIGANPAENHPMAFRWLMKAKDKGGKIIVIDPRYTKSAAVADLYAPHRPGTDIAFLLGIMNYAVQNNLYHHEYVVNYTNASYLVHSDFKVQDGVFSGYLGDGKYDTATWQYQKDGDTVLKDPTLQNPNCVFQILKKHLARYDFKTVCNITGTPEDLYKQVCDLFCSTGQPGKAGNIIYAMGITQHTHGSQNVRCIAMLQLLLGNMGIAGGGVNAQRGESNVQGSTDMAMLFHLIPGYNPVPSASKTPTLADYIEKETPKGGYWTNRPKFVISMLKAWYAENASADNDFCYDYLPKVYGDHSHMAMFDRMAQGIIKGLFAWGQNPVVGGPSAIQAAKALDNLEWMVGIEMVETETVAFWKRPTVDPKTVPTEVFLFPAAASYEKEGSVINSGRWMQWRWKAVDPPGKAHSDLWIVDRIFKAVRKEYEAGGVFPDPILKMNWDYGDGYPDIVQVAVEINGFEVASGTPIKSFAALKDDGSTACGCWIHAGYYGDLEKPACKSRVREQEGLGLHKEWGWSWPVNRRIVYNRASCDPSGKPWNPDKWLVRWDGAKWETRDVPDFGAAKDGNPVPPDVNAKTPFIMNAEGVGRLFAAGLKDGPLPEHYEPVESPVQNAMSKQQSNPCAVKYSGEFDKFAPTGSIDFPYIITTHRLIEHYQSGALTRNSPYLVELMPEMFVSISKGLASKLGINPGDMVVVSSARGELKCKAHVTPLVKPLMVNGQLVEMLCMPWHWGFQSLAPGATANDLSPAAGDPNTMIPEYKAFLGNIRKA
jgi:formate dehydrogenase major subunit